MTLNRRDQSDQESHSLNAKNERRSKFKPEAINRLVLDYLKSLTNIRTEIFQAPEEVLAIIPSQYGLRLEQVIEALEYWKRQGQVKRDLRKYAYKELIEEREKWEK